MRYNLFRSMNHCMHYVLSILTYLSMPFSYMQIYSGYFKYFTSHVATLSIFFYQPSLLTTTIRHHLPYLLQRPQQGESKRSHQITSSSSSSSSHLSPKAIPSHLRATMGECQSCGCVMCGENRTFIERLTNGISCLGRSFKVLFIFFVFV